MELFDAIYKRTSYRGEYTSEKVPYEDLEKIAEAGMAAPSGCNLQTTSFYIVDDEALVIGIAGLLMSPAVKTAPALIVAAMNTGLTDDFTFEKEDCAAAVENMLLAITALGYASCWIDGELLYEQKAEKISRILNMPEEQTPRVLLPVGKPASGCGRKPKLPFEQRTTHNKHE